jgi:hypothetical protein
MRLPLTGSLSDALMGNSQALRRGHRWVRSGGDTPSHRRVAGKPGPT